jgi:hypothetical protein
MIRPRDAEVENLVCSLLRLEPELCVEIASRVALPVDVINFSLSCKTLSEILLRAGDAQWRALSQKFWTGLVAVTDAPMMESGIAR